MTQYISNFKDNMAYAFEQALEEGKGIGQRIVTLDRSEEVLGETPEAQLKGRDRMITYELARVALGTLLIAFLTYQCIMHPGGVQYGLLGATGFVTLIALKEAAIHSVARQKEKKKFNIEEETEATQFSIQELIYESIQGLKKLSE